MDKKQITFSVAGEAFNINVSVNDEKNVLESAKNLDEKMLKLQKRYPKLSGLRCALMVALDTEQEKQTSVSKNNALTNSSTGRLSDLTQRIQDKIELLAK